MRGRRRTWCGRRAVCRFGAVRGGSRGWTVITGVAVLRVCRPNDERCHRHDAGHKLAESHRWTSGTAQRKRRALHVAAREVGNYLSAAALEPRVGSASAWHRSRTFTIGASISLLSCRRRQRGLEPPEEIAELLRRSLDIQHRILRIRREEQREAMLAHFDVRVAVRVRARDVDAWKIDS